MDEIQQNEFRSEIGVIASHYGELLMKLLKQARSLEEDNGAKHLQETVYEAFALGILTESKEDMGKRAIANIWSAYLSWTEKA